MNKHIWGEDAGEKELRGRGEEVKKKFGRYASLIEVIDCEWHGGITGLMGNLDHKKVKKKSWTCYVQL